MIYGNERFDKLKSGLNLDWKWAAGGENEVAGRFLRNVNARRRGADQSFITDGGRGFSPNGTDRENKPGKTTFETCKYYSKTVSITSGRNHIGPSLGKAPDKGKLRHSEETGFPSSSGVPRYIPVSVFGQTGSRQRNKGPYVI